MLEGFVSGTCQRPIVVLAPLKNGRLSACYSHIIAVMHCGSFVTFIENVNLAISDKDSDTK